MSRVFKGKNVSGFKKTRAKLRKLPTQLKAEIKDAISDLGNKLKTEMAIAIPSHDVDLRRAVKFRITKDSTLGSVGFSNKTGFKREWKLAGWRSHFTEVGTAPHIILSNKTMVSKDDKYFGNKVIHPGSNASPFFDITILKNEPWRKNRMAKVLTEIKKEFDK